jgi:hypothetical protein
MFDLQRVTLFLSLLILSGGYLAVFRPMEVAIAERYAELDDARTTLEQSTILEKGLAAMERERSRREAEMTRIHLRESRAAAVDRFLHALATVAARDAVTVERVLAGPATPTTAAGRTTSPPTALEELPLDVTLRGRYRDVIHAARELDSADLAAGIAVAELHPVAGRRQDAPQLDASFHVRLLREADATTKRV